MEKWEIFEKNVEKYLNKNISISGVRFFAAGSSDSNASDIHVIQNNDLIFTIECKLSPAQSSQFVVKQENNKFHLSPLNRSISDGTDEIINHMNANFKYYAGDEKSLELVCDKKLMYSRIVKQIKSKSVFFISSNVTENFSSANPLVLDFVENIPKHFNVSGKYRVKQSGTKNPSKVDLKFIPNYQQIGKYFFIYDPSGKLPDYHPADTSIYLQSPDSKGYRKLRKRSPTKNKNVIFSLVLNNNYPHTNLDVLTDYIKKLVF